jgi:tRNA(Ile)-lysidine synthetase-like protein
MKREIDPVVEIVVRTAAEEALFGAGDRVLAAVSGGADSLALLHVLWVLSREGGFELQVASLDHGLRGPAGEADRAFVARTAEQFGLVFHGGRADAAGLARRSGLSLEDAARRVRYEFLAGVALNWGPGASGPPRVAVGHTADDQAETVLMRLVEGTGLDGLGGMPVRRDEDGWVLVRPLLRVTRAQVRDYCARWGLRPREDETNEDLRFRRNMVRIRLMPALAEYNPRVAEALVRLADASGPEIAALEEEAVRRAGDLVSEGVPAAEGPFDRLEVSGPVRTLRRDGFKALDGWVKRRLIRRILREISSPEAWREIGLAGVDRALRAAEDLQVGGRLHLPGGVVLEAGYEHVFLAAVREQGGGKGSAPEPVLLQVPGQTTVEDLGWVFTAEWRQGASASAAGSALALAPEKVALPLKVRTRRRGEVLYPAGLNGSKKLKDFFISEKIPKAQRDRWPLVVDAKDRIVWVTALRGDARFVASPGLDRIIHLEAERR